MGTGGNRIADKDFGFDVAKIKRPQKLMQAGTEAETIERALDAVIAEQRRNRITRKANERFVKTGIKVRDAYGKLL